MVRKRRLQFTAGFETLLHLSKAQHITRIIVKACAYVVDDVRECMLYHLEHVHPLMSAFAPCHLVLQHELLRVNYFAASHRDMTTTIIYFAVTDGPMGFVRYHLARIAG